MANSTMVESDFFAHFGGLADAGALRVKARVATAAVATNEREMTDIDDLLIPVEQF
jgi:hypothetical protein